MSTVLDSGGVSVLATDRALVDALIRRGEWPPQVPAVVVTEALTGDPRRDHATNRILSMSLVRDVDQTLSRRAAYLRTRASQRRRISVVDAVVVALAESMDDPQVLTSDPGDVAALADQAERTIRTIAV